MEEGYPTCNDDRIVLRRGHWWWHQIDKYVEPLVKEIGMLPVLDGYNICIHPIDSYVEIDGYRLNVLQYAILESEDSSMEKFDDREMEMFIRAYESLIYGIDHHIYDIGNLYHTFDCTRQVDDELHRRCSGERLVCMSSELLSHIRRYGCHGCSIQEICGIMHIHANICMEYLLDKDLIVDIGAQVYVHHLYME